MTFSILDFSQRTDQPQAEPILDWGEKQMHKKFRIRFGFSRSDNRKSKICTELSRSIQNRKWVGIFAIVLTFVVGGVEAAAQQPKKVAQIGYLSNQEAALESPRSEAIRLALRDLGYIEGQNIAIEYRYADGKVDRFPALAAELVRLKVDIMLAAGEPAVLAAMNATKTIPIVLVGAGFDPVEAGHVESLARPGGNVTGIATLNRELGGKRLELFKEAVPKLARVAVLYDPAIPPSALAVKEDLPVCGARAEVDCSALGGTRFERFGEGPR